MKRVKEKNFTAFFEKNELGGYTVIVPSLPGLATEGSDFEHAKKMVRDAIKCYIEGLDKFHRKSVYENEAGSFQVAVSV